MDRAQVVIVGGGVVGCAIARALSERWQDVFLLEKQPKIGMGASTRNSGVIHSGLYYKTGSLKARHCLAGNRLTYEFCAAHGVPYRNTGKLVVASTESEEHELAELFEVGRKNGLEGLRIVDRARIREREPHVEGRAAIEVPSTGIVSAEDLVKAYARLASDHGANIVTHAAVECLEPLRWGTIRVVSEAGEIEARCLINAAGLFSDEVAGMLDSKLARHRIYPVRGEYCELVRAKANLLNALVYPLPHQEGLSLGVHLTRTLAGTVLVGPTARYIADKNDYEGNLEPIENFWQGARRLLPELQLADLRLAYTGIRAKLVPPGEKGPADFIIERDPEIPAAIHLIGIESPGLTAAPSIAQHVASLVTECLA